MRFEPPLSGRFKFSLFRSVSSLLCVFLSFHNSSTLLPRQNVISVCGNVSSFFDAVFFFFSEESDGGCVGVCGSRVPVTAYLWPFCFLSTCTVWLYPHPFFSSSSLPPHCPVTLHQQFYPSWMHLYKRPHDSLCFLRILFQNGHLVRKISPFTGCWHESTHSLHNRSNNHCEEFWDVKQKTWCAHLNVFRV